jgi:hypothetical protein
MAAGSLVRDRESHLKAAAFRKNGKFMEYEFAFPLRNEDLGDALWEVGKVYQIAFLVGPGEKFEGVTQETWMSDQLHIRLGSPSKDSIYHPPYLAPKAEARHPAHESKKGRSTNSASPR